MCLIITMNSDVTDDWILKMTASLDLSAAFDSTPMTLLGASINRSLVDH